MKNLITFIILLSPFLASSNEWVTGKVKVLEDYGSYGNSEYQVLITLSDQVWGGSGKKSTICTDRFRLATGKQGVTEEIKSRIYSMMLAAHMADKTIGLYIDEANGPICNIQIGRIGIP